MDGPLTEDLPHLARGPNGGPGPDHRDVDAGSRIGSDPGGDRAGGDFFGPHVDLLTVGDRVFARAIEGKRLRSLAIPTCLHRDLHRGCGRALVTLGESDEAFWEVWHVPNAETITKPVVLAEILEGDDPCWAEVVV